MKKSKYTDRELLSILKQTEGSSPFPDLSRENLISSARFYKWRAKYAGMDAPMMSRLKSWKLKIVVLKRCMPKNV